VDPQWLDCRRRIGGGNGFNRKLKGGAGGAESSDELKLQLLPVSHILNYYQVWAHDTIGAPPRLSNLLCDYEVLFIVIK
jgi:hypothetical protein